MEIKYFVARAFRYKESKNWEYSIVGMYNNLISAKQAFHANMGSIIKNTNDICMCLIYDSLGNRVDSDFSSNIEPEPEPEPEEE